MAWYHRLRNALRPNRVTEEIDREIAFHLAERVDELMGRGMTRADAERAAQRQFGNPAVQRERTRDADVLPLLESILVDVRISARSLARNPGFVVAAVATLALGIGANSASSRPGPPTAHRLEEEKAATSAPDPGPRLLALARSVKERLARR